MNDIKPLLISLGIKFDDLGNKLVFQNCPICKSDIYASLYERAFLCNACSPETILISEFFSTFSVSYDNSPIEFSELFKENEDDLFDLKRTIGINSGYQSLDQKIGGFKKGHLYVIAAETGMGKSVFVANLIINIISKSNIHCSYFDLENGRHASIKRFVSIKGMIPISDFENPGKRNKLQEIAGSLEGKLIYRDHVKLEPFTSTSEGKQMAENIGQLIKTDVKENKVEIVVIDPLENFELTETNYNSIGKVIIYFKNLSQELGISIIILHHLRKPNQNRNDSVDSVFETQKPKYRIPSIHDLVGSSKIANMATDVWCLVRQKESISSLEQGRLLLRILKAREGELGDVYFMMNMNTLKVAEIELKFLDNEPKMVDN